MPLTAVKLPGRQSIADELYAWIRNAIITGELQPRERLVEKAVADVANVSRTPVREALHRLQVSGLVRESGNGGMEVCEFSLDEMDDLCAVRETLEGMASGLAATSRSATDVEILENLVSAWDTAIADEASVDTFVALNHAFHERLWTASRNRYLAAELRELRELIEGLQGTTLHLPERQRQSNEDHRRIVEAIRDRNATEAAELARSHFRQATIARTLMRAEQGSAAV